MSFVETPLWLRVRWHGETAPGQLNVISREAYVGGLGEWCENHPQNAYLSLEMNSSWNISHLVWIGSAEHWLKQKQEWISPKTIAEGSAKKLAQRRSLFFFWIEYRNSEKVWFVYTGLHPCRKRSNGPKNCHGGSCNTISMHWEVENSCFATVHTSTQADSYVSFPVPTWWFWWIVCLL